MALPKPPSKRQRTNDRHDVGLLSAAPGAIVPAASSSWLKPTVEEWSEYWTSEVASLVVRKSDLAAVRRLFDYRDEHARALRSYRKKRLDTGSTGQTKLSPTFDAMVKLEKLMLPLEDRYGLSSLARLRLGAELGTAHKSLADMNAELDREVDDVVDDDRREVVNLPGLPNSG